MERVLKEKLLLNQLNDLLKKKEFNHFERAELVDELIRTKRESCPKCKSKVKKYGTTGPVSGKSPWCKVCGKVPEQIAKEIGVRKSEIYNIRKLVDVDTNVRKLVLEGKISQDKVIRIVSNLKTQNKKQELNIVKTAIKDDLDAREVEELVHEINNPKLVLNHTRQALTRAFKELKKAHQKVPPVVGWNDIEVKDMIKACRDMINAIETKAQNKHK